MFVLYRFSDGLTEINEETVFESYDQALKQFAIEKDLIKNYYEKLDDDNFEIGQYKGEFQVSYQGNLVQVLGVREI